MWLRHTPYLSGKGRLKNGICFSDGLLLPTPPPRPKPRQMRDSVNSNLYKNLRTAYSVQLYSIILTLSINLEGIFQTLLWIKT
ncbi:hypothetical protein HMPREF9123_0759 [Neisseria bacilliformis ATCC BAA-1200]|uniref:Uncharacterized protein n=1 Tax=Neisseria bacilliformis ATCC BAA-1200 TaxID=888742 RepID=F2BAM8_9NEIS|nr:hypothetical protein HMPREF9123_0759 [Neisseria bacilliformis ATCC BAA-1200]